MPASSAPDPRDEIAALRREVARLGSELDRVRAERDAYEVACHEDPVTGLLNRRGFGRELDRAVAFVRRYATPAALLVLDLDAFKPINDRHGHAGGDAALRHVAAVLRANLRASDTVARTGGDEFAALLWQLDGATALAKAAALEARLEAEPVRLGDAWVSVAGSIGVAPLLPGCDAATLLTTADAAMYARKEARRTARAGEGRPVPIRRSGRE